MAKEFLDWAKSPFGTLRTVRNKSACYVGSRGKPARYVGSRGEPARYAVCRRDRLYAGIAVDARYVGSRGDHPSLLASQSYGGREPARYGVGAGFLGVSLVEPMPGWNALFGKLRFLFCLVFLQLGFASASASENGVALVADGEAKAVLVVADEPLPALSGTKARPDHSQRDLAVELQEWLRKTSDVTLPIVSASEANSGITQILVGRSARTEALGLRTPKASEGVHIRSFDGGVALLGEVSKIEALGNGQLYDRGLQHAVRMFLERYLGYRFYFRHAVDGNEDFGVVIPDGDRLSVPAEIDFETAPAFSYRRTAKAGFDSWAFPGNPEQRVEVYHPDSSWKWRYKKSHPEYFLQRKDGSRDFRYLDYSEPGVVEQRMQNLEAFEAGRRDEYPGRSPNAVFIPVAPEDNLGTNHHPRARALAAEANNPVHDFEHQSARMGRQSNLYWSHIRDFAEAVQERWPERRIETLAYQRYTLPPDFELPGNVDVILCTLTASHLYKEPEAAAQVRELVKAWHEKLGRDRDRLRIWDYPCFPGFFTAAPVIYPKVKQQWLRDLRPYISGEYWNSMGRSAQESHWFLNLADRMLWNPDLDVEAYLADYTEKFFGPAAEPMERFYRLIIDRYENTEWSEHANSYDAGLYGGLYRETYPPEVIEELERIFNEALVMASTPTGGRAREVAAGDSWIQGNPDGKSRRYAITLEGRNTPLVDPAIAWKGGELRYRGTLYRGLRLEIRADADGRPAARLYPVDLIDSKLSRSSSVGGSERRRLAANWIRAYAHPGADYRVSVTGRTGDGGNSWAVLYFGKSGDGKFGPSFFGGTEVFPKGDEWGTATASFTVPEGTTGFNRLDLLRRAGAVYYAGASLMPDLPAEGIDVSDRIEGRLPELPAGGQLRLRLDGRESGKNADFRVTLSPVGVAPERPIYKERLLWMREWLEDFVPERSAYGGPRGAKMGFFPEARQAHEWTDRVPSYRIRRVTEAPAADFDDPVWQQARTTGLRYGLDDMNGRNSTPFNRMGFPPDLPTVMQAVHDGETLFLAFRAYQTHPPTAEDRLTGSFFTEDKELATFRIRADGGTEGADEVRSKTVVGRGWWGAFAAVPLDRLGGSPERLRANFTRFRTAAPNESGKGSEEVRVELPRPAGAETPPAAPGGAHYTWSPLIDGGLGWGRFPRRERGVLLFE